MNKLESYFLGLFLGDGSHVDSSKRIDIYFGRQEDAWGEVIKNVIEVCFGCSPKLYVYRRDGLQAFHINLYEVWNQYRFYKVKSIWDLPENFNRQEVLAGLFDTDGSVSFGLRDRGKQGDYFRILSFSSAYEKNIEIIKSLLDIPVKIRMSRTKGFREEFGNMFSIDIQNYFGFNYMWNEIPIKHPRKRRILDELLNSYKRLEK